MATTNPIVSAITGYVSENTELLISKAVLGADSIARFNLQSGVKGDTALNIMNTSVVFGANQCGWNESGSTDFSQRILKPAGLSVNMAFCDKNLLKTYANYKVRVAAGQKSLPFEEEWVASITNDVKEQLDHMIYFGQSGQTNEFEGLISILDAEAGTVDFSAATGTTAYAFIKGAAANIPAKVKNAAILVSVPMYREFMQDLVAANLFHYDPAQGENEYRLPGTDIKVIAVSGLNPATGDTYDYAIVADLENIFYGCDLEGDEEKYELWYSQDNREFRLAIEFVAGVQVAFPDEIVLAKRAR